MFKFFNKLKYPFLHVIIGLLSISHFFSIAYGISLLIGIYFIIRQSHKNNIVIYWVMYAVGAEVFLRISHGNLFHEYIKYLSMLFLFTAIIVGKNRFSINKKYIVYIILLLVSVFFVKYQTFSQIRQQVSFNLSGPILLGIGSIYFYRRSLHLDELLKSLYCLILPLISTLSYIFFYTPEVSSIIFKSAANSITSGGGGSNQVSTILGFGIFAILILIIYRKTILGNIYLDITLLSYMVYRELLTFSRGGMLVSIIVILIFLYYHLKDSKKVFKLFLKISILLVSLSYFLFSYTDSLTGGILKYRYTGKNTQGTFKKDFTSNRLGFAKDELEIFLENPVFGVGPGGSTYYRNRNFNMHSGSTHNEITRMISEHGIIGIGLLFFLLFSPLIYIYRYNHPYKEFLLAFYLFWFLTINHSAMRLAFPSIMYGLSLIILRKNEVIIHRK